MSWLKRDAQTGRLDSARSGSIISVRELPGKVVVRTVRQDVFDSGLRAAESSLRKIGKEIASSSKK